MEKKWKLFFSLGLQNHCGCWLQPWNQKMLAPWGKKAMTNLDSVLKSRNITLPTKECIVKAMDFPVIMVQMWELDHKEGGAPKNWRFQIVVTLKSPLDSKETKPVHPKWNQPWIFIGRTNAEAETPVLWPPDAKSWLTGKGPDAEKDWGQEEKGMTEDGWMASLTQWAWVCANSERVKDKPGCNSWGCKESDVTWWLNNN